MSRTMPKQKPRRSEQVVCTPKEFIRLVCVRLGCKFFIDLAALKSNAICNNYITPEEDSLSCLWKEHIPEWTWAWLNPPYANIAPWVKKASKSNRKIVVLVPASVGSNWWRDHVHEQAWVLFLNGRITFEGHKAGYPKDLALLVYGLEPGYDIWDWKRS